MTGEYCNNGQVRRSLGLVLGLLGCATGRTYTTDRFEVRIGNGTLVTEQRGRQRTDWKFADENGRQFLGASVYPVAGDPTFPCGIPQSDLNGAPAFLVRRTLGEVHVASLVIPQDDGTVLDFSYEEHEQLARDLVAKVAVRRPHRDQPIPCETLRTGGSLHGDTYDAGPFTVKLLPGTWLLDAGHFRTEDPQGGGWLFEEAATGKRFLSAFKYSSDVFETCPEGALIQINGSTAFRRSDTDNLEPYPGPSNVTVTFVKLENRRYHHLLFVYDEHSSTAHLAEKTLESVRFRDPALVEADCERIRRR